MYFTFMGYRGTKAVLLIGVCIDFCMLLLCGIIALIKWILILFGIGG